MIPDTYNPRVAGLFPFRALRPTPAAAKDVAAVPYDVVTTEEAAALAHGNPLSFLRVSRPEIDLPPGTDPHADIVYDKAARNFRALQAAAPLVREEHETLYVYRLRMGSHEQTGVAACFAMDEYDAIRQAGGPFLGSFTVNTVFPSPEDKDTVPPWARTIWRTMNNPRPVPFTRVATAPGIR